MTLERARHILIQHSQNAEQGFCASLRPFRGLRRDYCAQIEEAFLVVAPELQHQTVDQQLICALWDILWTARNWALLPGSMLRRNHLISPEEVAFLQQWVGKMDNAICITLQGAPIGTELEEFDNS